MAKASSASDGDGPISFKSSIVQHEKVVGGNKHVMLEWTNEAGEKDVLWHAVEKVAEKEVFKCDTKKDKAGLSIYSNLLSSIFRIKGSAVTALESILRAGHVVSSSRSRFAPVCGLKLILFSLKNYSDQRVPLKCMPKLPSGCQP